MIKLYNYGAFNQGGFLFVEDILTMQQFKKYTVDDVKHVVLTNEKRRFFMEEDRLTGKLKIRANQGHTVQVKWFYVLSAIYKATFTIKRLDIFTTFSVTSTKICSIFHILFQEG